MNKSGNGVEVFGQSGFLLQRIEVLNWGTFDEQIHVLNLAGATTLLVGQNGSGKSTLVDALLTLLVPPGIRNFNVAAGGKKTERDERSYFKGAYDRGGDDTGAGSQVMFLRPKGDHYSVILGHFRNSATQKQFTIAQLLYLGSDQSIEKVYCFSEVNRNIREHFASLDSFDGILKILRQRDFRVTRKYVEFAEWFTRFVKVKAKAMEVFNQTVAVKDIQRLNDFIRNHMLEQHDWDQRVDRLLAHFTQLSEAHQALVRVKQQHDALEPLSITGLKYSNKAREHASAQGMMAATELFFARKTVDIFMPALVEFNNDLRVVKTTRDQLSAKMQSNLEEQRGIKNDIESAGGDRLKQIPLLIDVERSNSKAKAANRQRFTDRLTVLKIEFKCDSQSDFDGVRQTVLRLVNDLNPAIEAADRDRGDLLVKRGLLRSRLDEYRKELDGLNQRRENLPEWCVELRQIICQNLGLAPKDLPFVAELIAVPPAHRDWEISIERVLHSFALSLLVPERLYGIVSKYVDGTRLSSQGRGQRLSYRRVGEQVSELPRGYTSDPHSMLQKLIFREGQALLPWVKVHLSQSFDYRCCESIEEFQECRGLAMTRNRHFKSGASRHDKDDRDPTMDARTFVLGWDNREKKRVIAAAIHDLVEQEKAIENQIRSSDELLGTLRTRLAAVSDLRQFDTFDEIDFLSHETRILSLEQERKSIESQSETIRALKEILTRLEDGYQELEQNRDSMVANERELNNKIRDAGALIGNANRLLSEGIGDRDHQMWFDEVLPILNT